jgi:4-hydroxy-3-polyprenylbenzoate decarboxylase
MALLPEVTDFHMPEAGVAHNLVIVKIRKDYPGQGMKVLNSLFGAGQMMFSKYIIAVSGDTDIRDYSQLARHIFDNLDVRRDLLFSKGPLDVLDHASDTFSFGGKLGVDATIKLPEEVVTGEHLKGYFECQEKDLAEFKSMNTAVRRMCPDLCTTGIPVIILTVDQSLDGDWRNTLKLSVSRFAEIRKFRALVVVEHTVDPGDFFTVAWQVLGNTDPLRDHEYAEGNTLILDGTIKAYRKDGFARRWPNAVCSSDETIMAVDAKWELLKIGPELESPSLKTRTLVSGGRDEIVI